MFRRSKIRKTTEVLTVLVLISTSVIPAGARGGGAMGAHISSGGSHAGSSHVGHGGGYGWGHGSRGYGYGYGGYGYGYNPYAWGSGYASGMSQGPNSLDQYNLQQESRLSNLPQSAFVQEYSWPKSNTNASASTEAPVAYSATAQSLAGTEAGVAKKIAKAGKSVTR